MKKWFKFYLVLITTSIGCTKEYPSFEFTNNSNIKIDSLKVSASDDCKTKFRNIHPKQKVNGKIFFCDNTLGDGSYGISIYKDGKLIKRRGFGYYTNGASLSNNFDIEYTNQNYLIITEN
jgi:hypothetical protein